MCLLFAICYSGTLRGPELPFRDAQLGSEDVPVRPDDGRVWRHLRRRGAQQRRGGVRGGASRHHRRARRAGALGRGPEDSLSLGR